MVVFMALAGQLGQHPLALVLADALLGVEPVLVVERLVIVAVAVLEHVDLLVPSSSTCPLAPGPETGSAPDHPTRGWPSLRRTRGASPHVAGFGGPGGSGGAAGRR